MASEVEAINARVNSLLKSGASKAEIVGYLRSEGIMPAELKGLDKALTWRTRNPEYAGDYQVNMAPPASGGVDVRKEGALTAYEPSLLDRLRNGASDALASFGMDRGGANRLASRATGFANDLTPVGDAATGSDALAAFRRGNWGEGAGLGVLAAVGAVPGLGDATAKVVRGPWDRAAQFAAGLAERGHKVGEVRTSTNRHGGKSAYVDSPFGELRFSDHEANMDFRPGQVDVWGDDVDGFLSAAEASQRKAASRRAEEATVLASREAPYRDRFLMAPQHKQFDIIVEAYPDAIHNKAQRKDIAARWSRP